MILITISTCIGFGFGFLSGAIFATGQTLCKVQDWEDRSTIRPPISNKPIPSKVNIGEGPVTWKR